MLGGSHEAPSPKLVKIAQKRACATFVFIHAFQHNRHFDYEIT